MKKCLFSILSILITLSNYAQNVGINTTPSSPPTNTLDINGTLRVRGGTPGTGKVLTSDANGVGSWTTPSANYPRISYDAILALPSPTKGDIAYDNTFDCLRVYTGNKWICTYQNPSNFTPNMIAIASAGGISSSDASYSIAVDGSGNVYITGYYAGTASFGATSITSAGSVDMFVAKYNNTGTFQWVQSAGGTLEDVGNSIAVDGSGNVYVTGGYKGTAIFGTTSKTSAGISDVFVVKYNNSGTFQWVQSAGGTSDDVGNSIALDVSGNIYVTGGYYGTATFGTTPISAVGNADIFMVKYNSSGFVQWVQTAGGSNFDSSKSITLDALGNIYMTGYYFGTTTFGVISKTSTGSADIFIAKYDPSGASWLWLQSAGSTGNDYGQSIALDASGNVYTTGYYFGTAIFGSMSVASAGGNEIFLTKYNNTGTFQWVKSAGGTINDVGNSVAVDGSGNVYVTGYYQGTATFGTITKTSVGSLDMFVAKYNSSGSCQWLQSAGGTSGVFGNSIALDASGNIYVTGYYGGTATFGSTTITSSDNSDIFVSRLDK